MVLTLVVFFATYLWLITERAPRHVVVLCGAGALLLGRAVTLGEAWHQINWNMIGILFGLFVIVGILFEMDVFNLLGAWIIRLSKGHPTVLFFVLPLLAGVLSMALNNIAVMLFVSLLTLEICRSSHLDPAILIASEVCIANAGGGATLIGSPPNLLMGSAMGYRFGTVFVHMGPLAIVAAGLMLLVYFIMYRRTLTGPSLRIQETRRWKKLPGKLVFKVWERMDWQTLLFFIGISILVGTLDKVGVFGRLAGLIMMNPHSVMTLILLVLAFAAVVSAFIDNVPMALSMAYLIKDLRAIPGSPPESLLVWAALIGLTVGGNMTPIGASPNIVAYAVLEHAGIKIGWKRWATLTVPATLAALVGVSLMLWVKYSTGWY
jgi:Na+/H+ antiporter NhaD/arsenite permease-like protein